MKASRKNFGLVALGVAVAAVAIIGSAVAASTNGRASKAPTKDVLKIAWVGADFTNPLYASIRAQALKEAKIKGVTLLTTGSNDPVTQINAMQTYLGEGVDVLAMSAVNLKAALAVVKQANAANIPVIAVHGAMPGAKVATTITLDFYAIGQTMGSQIIQYCKKLNPCKLALFVGSRGDDASVLVQKGVTDQLKTAKASNIKVVANPATGFDPNEASSATSDVLTQYPDINAMWYVWSAGVLAGIEAVKSAGKTGQIGMFSGSGVCQMLKDDLDGTLNGDGLVLTEYEGKALVDSAIAAAAHKKLPASQGVPYYALNKSILKGILAGTVKPPASIAPIVVSRVAQAKRGSCPSS